MDQSQKTKDTSQTPESRSRRVYRQRVGAFSESRPDRSFGGSVFGVENGWEEPSLHRKDVVGSFLALSHGRKTPQAFIRLFHRGLSKSFSRSKPISQFLQNFSRVHPGSSVRQFPSFIYFLKKKKKLPGKKRSLGRRACTTFTARSELLHALDRVWHTQYVTQVYLALTNG